MWYQICSFWFSLFRTNPNEVIEKLEQNHRSMKNANLNNIPLKEEKLLELFEALRHNTSMEELSLGNKHAFKR